MGVQPYDIDMLTLPAGCTAIPGLCEGIKKRFTKIVFMGCVISSFAKASMIPAAMPSLLAARECPLVSRLERNVMVVNFPDIAFQAISVGATINHWSCCHAGYDLISM